MANNKMNIEGKNYSDIPVWRRYTLTIEEAARYYHIGEGKLRTLIDTHRKNKVRLLSFYGDDGDGGDDDIDITQLSGWGIPERPSPSSPSSLGALEGSKHGRSVATGQPAANPTGPAPNPCEAAGA